MANVDTYGSVIATDGRTIPLLNTATTEATEDEVLTNATWTGAAQNLGTYADQMGNFVVGSGVWKCETAATWNYIRSAGKVKLVLPMCSNKGSGAHGLPAPVPYPKKLDSGDSLIVMAQATSTRSFALAVACSNREYHVFEYTATGASSGQGHELLSVVTGQGIGTTLQGRTITHWYVINGANTTQLTSDLMLLDGAGVVVASVSPVAFAGSAPILFQRVGPRGARVHLNSKVVYTTNA